MKVGEQLSIKIGEAAPNTIRNYASDLGFLLNRVYSASVDRVSRSMIITRFS